MTAALRRLTGARYEQFLARFVDRGWLHGTRDNAREQEAVDYGLRRGWLRRELGEVHFTVRGRRVLANQ